jgi:hypothetical protein
MIIDFREIPYNSSQGALQDSFELFGRDFLECMGYEIIQHPFRGADGKKDMIVSETRPGIMGETKFNFLVSCKHNAHSGKSVTDKDEPDITDRVRSHNCAGFIGIYSTIPSKSLSEKTDRIRNAFAIFLLDKEAIEREVLSHNKYQILLKRYFPKSFNRYNTANNIRSKPLDLTLLIETLETKLPIENKYETIEDYEILLQELKDLDYIECKDLDSLIDRHIDQALADDRKIANDILTNYIKGKGIYSRKYKCYGLSTLDRPRWEKGVFMSHCRLVEHMFSLAYGKNWTRVLRSANFYL